MLLKHVPFFCKVGPLLAEDWMWKLEKILDSIWVQIDEDRIWLATYPFKSNAEQWWRDIKDRMDLTGMTWADFKIMFLTGTSPLLRGKRIRRSLKAWNK